MKPRETLDDQGGRHGIAEAHGALPDPGRVTQEAAVVGRGAQRDQQSRIVEQRRRRPEFVRRHRVPAPVAADLFEVVGQPVAGCLVRCGGDARADTGQGAGDAVAWPGAVRQSLVRPVVVEQVPLAIGQIAGGGGLEQREREMRAAAEAPGVDRGLDQGRGGRRGFLVAVEENGDPGQVLGDLPVGRAARGLGKARVGRGGLGQAGQVRGGERGREVDPVAGEEFPRVFVRIPAVALGGRRGEDVPVLRPEGREDEDRATGRVAEEFPQAGGHPFADVVTAGEVELGLVQPYDGPCADPGEIGQGGFGPSRVDRVPQRPWFGAGP